MFSKGWDFSQWTFVHLLCLEISFKSCKLMAFKVDLEGKRIITVNTIVNFFEMGGLTFVPFNNINKMRLSEFTFRGCVHARKLQNTFILLCSLLLLCYLDF